MNLTEQIIEVILSHQPPAAERRVGVEVECILYDSQFRRLPVNPGNRYSASDFLEEIRGLSGGLQKREGYSMEPGGQMEWASATGRNLTELQAHLEKHRAREQTLCRRRGIVILDLGLEPLYRPEEVELIDQKKYQLMDSLFQRTGRMGPWMMRNSVSVQVNIDYTSREEAEEMAFVADCLDPLATILFANSPFSGGEPAHRKNLRYRIWQDTDPSRCGYLLDHGIQARRDLLPGFARMVQKIPAIFALDSRGQVVAFEGRLGQWLESLQRRGELNAGQVMTALHQVFTQLRFKDVLEVRGADRPPAGFELAPAAFWLGLLGVEGNRRRVLEAVQSWSPAERRRLNLQAGTLDLDQQGPQGRPLGDWLGAVAEWSLAGLAERHRSGGVEDERPFLKPFLESVLSRGPHALQVQEDFRASKRGLKEYLRSRYG